MAGNTPKLFAELQYYICGTITAECQQILATAGAKCHSYLSELVKVAISETTEDDNEYSEISDIYDIPVVSCKWVTLSQKCGKLLPTKAFPPEQSQTKLLKDMVCCTSHLEKSDTSALWAMITFHGGKAERTITEKTTHLICISDSGSKFAQCLETSRIKLVTPEWLIESIKQQRIVDEKEFHPKYLVTSSQSLRDKLRTPPPVDPSVDSKAETPQKSEVSSSHNEFQTPPRNVQSVVPETHLTPTVSNMRVSSPATSAVTQSFAVKFQNQTEASSTLVKPTRPTVSIPAPTAGIMPSVTAGGHVEYNQQNMGGIYAAQSSNMPPPHTQAMQPNQPQYPMHPMSSQYQPRYNMPPQLQKPSQPFVDQGFRPPNYQQAQGMGHVMPPTSGHMKMQYQQQQMMGMQRPVSKPNQPPSQVPPGMGYPPIRHVGARQSPVPPNIMNMPIQMNPQLQRSSPSNRKTPPMMNLGQMTEVPFPSQASMPEETPIIRMTNMAAFPMGSEVTASPQSSRQRTQSSSGKSTPTKSPLHFAPSPGAQQPHPPQSKSPVANNNPTNISVIKSSKSPVTTPAPTSGASPAVGEPASAVTTSSPGRNGQSASLPASSTSATAMDTAPPQPVVYYGYDSNETVPHDMCLVGCIFYMGDYIKTDPCDQWTKAIEQNGGTVDPSYSNRVTHVLVETQAGDVCRLALNDHKRVVTAHWLNDVIGMGKMEPPWRAHHLPHPHQPDKQLCSNQVIGITGFNKTERKILKVLTEMIGASFTSYLARSNTALVCKKIEGEKVLKAQDWGVPCVNVQWLSELVLGNLRALKLPIDNKYQVFSKPDDFLIEQSMASVVMSGWRVPLKIPKDCWRKFKPNSKSGDSASTNKHKAEDELLTNPTKRFRLQEIQNTRSNLPPGQKPYILLTGFTNAEKTKYSEMIDRLGGIVSNEPSQCSHLIAEKIVRTPNFLTAINYCSYITSAEWVVESAKSGHFVDERVFTLQNSEAGSMWNILEALERRRTHGKPFTGLTFHISRGVPESTHLPRQFLSQLIIAAGGSVQSPQENRLSVQKISNTRSPSQNGKPTYIVISCKDDIHINMDLLNNGLDVYSVEFVLSGVMTQQAAYGSVLCIKETSPS